MQKKLFFFMAILLSFPVFAQESAHAARLEGNPGNSPYFSSLGLTSLKLRVSPGSRRCCLLGTNLEMLGLIPTQQTIDPSRLGQHAFGSGKGEFNGMVGTCAAGFLDIAHIRYAADLTVKLAFKIESLGQEGGVLDLRSEGSRSQLLVLPVTQNGRSRMRSIEEVLNLAGSVALDLTTWHEILTWYNFSAVPFYTEKGSAFSPEDAFSNQMGIALAKKAVMRALRDRTTYSDAMTEELDRLMKDAGAFVESETIRILAALETSAVPKPEDPWFDTQYQVPNYRRLLKRNGDFFGEVSPVSPPKTLLPSGCLQDTMKLAQASLWSEYHLELRLKRMNSASRAIHQDQEWKVSQWDFPALIEDVKSEIRLEWGSALFDSFEQNASRSSH